MNNQENQIILNTSKELESFNHPDSYRIAKEICFFTNFNSIKISKIIFQLKKNKPWEYIRGWAEFDGLELDVNKHTLIPRIETLQILEIVKESINKDIKQIVDVGSGSGAIGIALSRRHEDLKVLCVEKYKRTIDILERNINKYKQENISLIQSDLISKIKITTPTLVVANLPYIPLKDYKQLDKSVKGYEPKNALLGGENGLDIILKLVKQCEKNKFVNTIILEIDPSQKSILENMDLGYRQEYFKDFRGLFRFLKLNC